MNKQDPSTRIHTAIRPIHSKRNPWKIATIILIVVGVLYLLLSTYMISNSVIERDYYKEMMLTFCETAVWESNTIILYYDNTFEPVLPEGCDYYLLENVYARGGEE